MRDSDRESLRRNFEWRISTGMTPERAREHMYGVCDRMFAEGRMSREDYQECAEILGPRPARNAPPGQLEIF
jgi:hypothetical protein